jgi:hypothetical protein
VVVGRLGLARVCAVRVGFRWVGGKLVVGAGRNGLVMVIHVGSRSLVFVAD